MIKAQDNCVHQQCGVPPFKTDVEILPSSTGESWYSIQLQKDKLVAVPPVAADFAWGQNVGSRSSVIAAVTLKSVILTADRKSVV